MPGPGWTCDNGNWKPPAPSTCTTPKPGPDWVCVNGDWKPPSTPDSSPDQDTEPISMSDPPAEAEQEYLVPDSTRYRDFRQRT